MSCSSLLSLLSLQLKRSLHTILRKNRTTRTISFGPDAEGQQGEKNDHDNISETTDFETLSIPGHRTDVFIYVYVYIYLHICIHVYIHLCLYIYI